MNLWVSAPNTTKFKGDFKNMLAVENKIFEVLTDLEIKLMDQAVFYDGSSTLNVDDIDYFQDGALELFDQFANGIEEIIFNEVKIFIDKKIDVK